MIELVKENCFSRKQSKMLCDQCGNCEYYEETLADEGECDNRDSEFYRETVGYDEEICWNYEEKEI